LNIFLQAIPVLCIYNKLNFAGFKFPGLAAMFIAENVLFS